MRHLKLALLIFAVTTFAVACASTNTTVSNGNSNNTNTNSNAAAVANTATNAPAASDELASARATYKAVCARCHQENGEGGTVEFDEGGSLKVPSFKSGHGLTHTEAQFARQIAKGGDGMPAFEKKLTPEQINGLVRYIRQEIQAGLLKDGAPNPSH